MYSNRWMIWTVCLLASLTLFSVAGTDIGINIVGHVQTTCPRGRAVLLSMPFESAKGRPIHAQELLGHQLPPDSKVHVYDPLQKVFITDTREADLWSDNIVFRQGTAFWVTVPGTAPEPVYSFALTGQIPMSGAVTNVMPAGVQLCGNPYPADMTWTNMALAKGAREGDELYIMDPESPPRVYGYSGASGWGAASNLVIKVGMGFWYKNNANALTNVDARPYRPLP